MRSDNGPEFLGESFIQWLKENSVAIHYIQPDKPNQNAYIERFNRTFREEVFDLNLFVRLEDVREAAWWWMIEYNEESHHDSLGDLTPANSVKKPPTLVLNSLLDGEAYDGLGTKGGKGLRGQRADLDEMGTRTVYAFSKIWPRRTSGSFP